MADQIQSSTTPNQTISIPNDPAVGQSLTGLPDAVPVKMIDRKSTDWTLYHYAWDLMNFLYVGGAEMEAVAEQFLKKRSKELPDVYQSRVERFAYENHVGTCVDYYLAGLFETPPAVEIADDKTELAGKIAPPPPAAQGNLNG